MAKTGLFITLGILVAWPAAVLLNTTAHARPVPLCEANADRKNPRRIDIRFPGKVVTVVGHARPSFRDDKGLTFESYLWKQFNDVSLLEKVKYSDSDATLNPEGAKIRKRIQLFLEKDGEAAKQWSEDLAIVKEALRSNSHKIFAVERGESKSMVAEFNEHNAADAVMAAAVNGSMLLNELMYSNPDEREQLMSLALSPVMYLANKGSDVFGDAKVITVAYGQSQTAAQKLAGEKQSGLLLIDIHFLPAQVAMLQQECLQQINKKRPAERGPGNVAR